MSPDSEPMIAGSNLQGLCKVEYNPSNGDNNGAVFGNRYGLRGQIQVRQGSSAESIMTIVGPLVENSVSGGTWDWTYAVDDENVMKYNDVENCYEITITTKKDQEGKEFRFSYRTRLLLIAGVRLAKSHVFLIMTRHKRDTLLRLLTLTM